MTRLSIIALLTFVLIGCSGESLIDSDETLEVLPAEKTEEQLSAEAELAKMEIVLNIARPSLNPNNIGELEQSLEVQNGFGVDARRKTRCQEGVTELCIYPNTKTRRVWIDGSCNNSVGGLAYIDVIKEAARRASTALNAGYTYSTNGTSSNHHVRIGCASQPSMGLFSPINFTCNGVERDEFGNPILPQQCFISRSRITIDRTQIVTSCSDEQAFGLACANFAIAAFQHELGHDAGLGHAANGTLMAVAMAARSPWTSPIVPTSFEINLLRNYCAPDICGF